MCFAGFSRYLPAFLNRQFITILHKKGLGIPDHVFKGLQASFAGDLA